MTKERNNYCVYKHTLPDGRCYIGATNRGKERWGYEGCNYRNHPLFYSLICQIGWSNIKHEILTENLSKEDAQRLEKQLIIEAKENKISLNRLSGGYCMAERGHRTKETKRKIGEKNSHPHTKEAIKHFRESCQWRFRPIAVYKEDKLIGEYESINQAATALGITKTRILRALKYNCRSKEYRFEELPNNAVRKQPRKYYYKTKSK